MRDLSPPAIKRHRIVSSDEAALPEHRKGGFLIFSWNVNGIEPLIQKPIDAFSGAKPSGDSPIRAFLRRHAWPEVLCLQEIKIKPTDVVTQRAVELAVKSYGTSKNEPNYIVKFCLPTDAHNARAFGGKMYGVATIIRDDVALDIDSCRQVEWDREGRVLVLETKSKLAILNIYAVNGTSNPYRDPKSGVEIGTRHDRKLQFHRALLRECLDLENAGFLVVLAGDMNIARGHLDGHPSLRTVPYQHVINRADFNEKFFSSSNGLHALDTFRHIHGERRKFTYFPRNKEWGTSCDRVDLIMTSRMLEDVPGLLQEADILDSPQERSSSDHVPLYISLNKDKLHIVLLTLVSESAGHQIIQLHNRKL